MPSTTPALLIIDVQLAADDPKYGVRNNPDAELHIGELLDAWRQAGAPVWHVRDDSTDPDSPYHPGKPTHAFKPGNAPLADEPVSPKQTSSAFAGTQLAAQLKSEGINQLVICGVHTNKCVETTVRDACDLGFKVWLAADACWTTDKVDLTGRHWTGEEVHQLSIAGMHGTFAEVVDTPTAIALLGAGRT